MDVILNSNEVVNSVRLDALTYDISEIKSVRVVDYNDQDLKFISQMYDLDLTIFSKKEDIEISSHYIQSYSQLSINFTIPHYTKSNLFVEEDIYIFIKEDTIFTFLSSGIESSLHYLLPFGYESEYNKMGTFYDLFISLISAISDYYADIVELISKKIKELFEKTLKSKQFSEADLDYITELNFNNLLTRESLSEFQRILYLFKRGGKDMNDKFSTISDEIYDLTVITDYLQSNFDRLDDLKENINSKIELEQNKIFKILTIITVCVSLPTLIAGVYGMNFMHMPGLKWVYGYPMIVVLMFFSFIMPLIYFKKKQWF